MFYEDLHSSSQSQDEVDGWLLLYVVISEASFIFELLSGEDESLLVFWDAFLGSDLFFQGFDGFVGFDFYSHGSASQGFDEDLHSSSQSPDEVDGWLLLYVVISEASFIFELLSGEDESLLIGWYSFSFIDFVLQSLNGLSWLHLDSHSFSCEGFDKELHLMFFIKWWGWMIYGNFI